MAKVITTLIYVERGDEILFLNRNKKTNDMNGGKFIGIGGHLEKDESIIDCLKREAFEETGSHLTEYYFLGIINFINTSFPTEDIFLFTGKIDSADLIDCDEGELVWINKKDILSIPLWEGDKYFLPYVINNPGYKFLLTLKYDKYVLTNVIGPDRIDEPSFLDIKNPIY